MLTIISGTNRKNSMTNKVAKHTLNLAKEAGIDANLIDLAELPTDFIRSEQYSPEALPQWLIELQSNFLIPAAHFVIISPEYNGSIPGYLKLFIDALSVHKIKETFYGKQAALIGVASGRAGNLRGMDHLTAILNHMGCYIVPGSLPLSEIGGIIDESGNMDENSKKLISKHLKKAVNI